MLVQRSAHRVLSANARAPTFVTFDLRAGAGTSWSPRIPCINCYALVLAQAGALVFLTFVPDVLVLATFVTFDFRAGARTSWSSCIPRINSLRAGTRTSWSTRFGVVGSLFD